jgi:hypothetical protein
MSDDPPAFVCPVRRGRRTARAQGRRDVGRAVHRVLTADAIRAAGTHRGVGRAAGSRGLRCRIFERAQVKNLQSSQASAAYP